MMGNSVQLTACVLLFAAAFAAADLNAQATQREAAQILAEGSPQERFEAVMWTQRLAPQEIQADLRTALIRALHDDNRHYNNAWQAIWRGEPGARFDKPEFDVHIDLVELVASLRDPAAIPALAGALGTGWTANSALVELGNRSIPAILAVVRDPRSHPGQVRGGLVTLRAIVEDVGADGLTPASRSGMRATAKQRLTGQQFETVLWTAIDLAVALGDPDLRQIVQRLADDPAEVRARGVTEQDLAEKTRQRAADRLAGIPAPPRPRN